MAERRGLRLALELAFLAALAAALTFADLRDYEIGGAMLLGWLVVAVFEWGALRGRPHFGPGLPPRWYVPPLRLPPPLPLEQVVAGYPAAEPGGDEVTWIAPAALHADWPVGELEQAPVAVVDEETQLRVPLPEPGPDGAGEPASERRAPPPPDPAPGAARTAWHHIDPLAAPAGRKARRRGAEEPGLVEVPWRPPAPRPLPRREQGGGA